MVKKRPKVSESAEESNNGPLGTPTQPLTGIETPNAKTLLELIDEFHKLKGSGGLDQREYERMEELRCEFLAYGGRRAPNSGWVVVENPWLVFGCYRELMAIGAERDGSFEEELFWEAVELIEAHVYGLGRKASLALGEIEYFERLSNFLIKSRVPKGTSVWDEEVRYGQWGVLRAKLREKCTQLTRLWHSGGKISELGILKIEERIEPLFNKVLKQLVADADSEGLSTGEKLKLFDKLSYLLAEMKGERKPDSQLQVTHNNVFAMIMERKKELDPGMLQAKAIELLEGKDYELF